jgi:hypothetical protein
MNYRRLRKRFGKEPAAPREGMIRFWRNEFAKHPEANAIRVKFMDRIRGQKRQPWRRWEACEVSVVRVRACKGKRT